jgi:hypothetical protein
MMNDIKGSIKVWLDDCLLHTETVYDLLATLNFFFKQCQKNGSILHDSKCVLYSAAQTNLDVVAMSTVTIVW